MLMKKAVQLIILLLAVLLERYTVAAKAAAVKLCGRQLSEIVSRVCHAYNSPSWDVPTVVEQPSGTVRRRRQLGIADECCIIGCTWEQLSEYCSIVKYAYSDAPHEDPEEHVIEDRSAEQGSGGQATKAMSASTPVAVREAGRGHGREGAKHTRRRGYGRRCWCRRKRRSGRRRSTLMGNMDLVKNAVRAAPVVGTVSPLITWGRTLNTNLPLTDRERYAYVVYT